MTIKNKSKPPVGGGGADTAVNRTTTDDTIGTAFIAPMGRGRSSGGVGGRGLYRTPSGDLIEIDADRQRIIDSGYTILSGEDRIPTGPNTWETVTPSELRMRENPEYRERARKYDEPSGLSLNGLSGYKE